MASKMDAILDKSVRADKETGWAFQCPGIATSPCGDLATGQPFVSSGWPTKEVAKARGKQHLESHRDLTPMQPLDEFRQHHNLVPKPDGTAVKLEDL